MMNKKVFLALLLVAVLASGVTLGVYKLAGFDRNEIILQEAGDGNNLPQVRFTKGGNNAPADFTQAAALATPMVVHIIATQSANQRSSRGNQRMDDLFKEFFGGRGGEGFRRRSRPAQSSGSGVIVTKDGYIVTNNHVIDNSSKVEVILNNKKTYDATIIGADPSTDLALLKINEKNLPAIVFGNSDKVKVGEWVLAVGNPFNLESTVTAGIVSAKGRSLNMLQRGAGNLSAIESFIQTDAAVNPGNSGGALINTKGELIGINTAIATRTGSFAGYSFAVPTSIVRKVMKDLVEFGTVQRAVLGIQFSEINRALAKQEGLKISEGIYVGKVVEGGSADAAGIKEGDVIIEMDGKKIKGSPDLLEVIGRKRPGDKAKVKLSRNGQIKTLTVKLKNRDGNEKVVKRESGATFNSLGAEFKELTSAEKKRLDINGGVKVSKLSSGTLRTRTEIEEGFVITEVNGRKINSVSDVKRALNNTEKGKLITIGGLYPNDPGQRYYAFKK